MQVPSLPIAGTRQLLRPDLSPPPGLSRQALDEREAPRQGRGARPNWSRVRAQGPGLKACRAAYGVGHTAVLSQPPHPQRTEAPARARPLVTLRE